MRRRKMAWNALKLHGFGMPTSDVDMRDRCADVTQQTGQQWEYVRINQSDCEAREPRTLVEVIQVLIFLQA
jgi:hypothetical protein